MKGMRIDSRELFIRFMEGSFTSFWSKCRHSYKFWYNLVTSALNKLNLMLRNFIRIKCAKFRRHQVFKFHFDHMRKILRLLWIAMNSVQGKLSLIFFHQKSVKFILMIQPLKHSFNSYYIHAIFCDFDEDSLVLS